MLSISKSQAGLWACLHKCSYRNAPEVLSPVAAAVRASGFVLGHQAPLLSPAAVHAAGHVCEARVLLHRRQRLLTADGQCPYRHNGAGHNNRVAATLTLEAARTRATKGEGIRCGYTESYRVCTNYRVVCSRLIPSADAGKV